MQLLFLDDAIQNNPTRPGVNSLIAVGGVVVEDQAVRALENEINNLCTQYKFPKEEVFKWSPSRKHWMRENLIHGERQKFFCSVLELAKSHGVVGQVIISDKTKALANKNSGSHQNDVLIMALERFDRILKNFSQWGIAIVAQPSGDRSDEKIFLGRMAEVISAGTEYVAFSRLTTNILTMPFTNSRLLQLADLVVSITTALVAGNKYAEPIFPFVKNLLRSYQGRIGGVGLKIHPDLMYINLYHWLLGDEIFIKNLTGGRLPKSGHPYFDSENSY